MQAVRFCKVAARGRTIESRNALWNEVADSVHQATGANGEHRETEILEAHKDSKFAAAALQGFADQYQVVRGMLHADKARYLGAQLLESVHRSRHGRATWNVVHHQRNRTDPAYFSVVGHQPAL